MSRTFNGTNQSLQSAAALSALSGVSRIAVGFWLNTVFASDDDVILELSATSNTNAGSFKILGNESGTNSLWVDALGNVGKNSGRGAAPSNSTWHQVLVNLNFGNAATTEIESVYVDGSPVTLTIDATGGNNTGTFGSYVLNVMSRNNASLFADGSMADLCIWTPSSALTLSDAQSLYGGSRATLVRNSEIAYYWPLAGTTSPEPASIGSTALTVNGATGGSDPPAISGPARNIMPVNLGAVGTWNAPASSVTVSPGYPTNVANDLIVATLGIKPDTATVATPASWAAGPTQAVGSGTQGVGTGALKAFTFTRTSAGGLTGSQAFTITSGSSDVGVMHAWQYDATGYTSPQWEALTCTGGSHASSTTMGVTGAAGLDLQTGDVLAYLHLTSDDAASTVTISGLAATGATLTGLTVSPTGTIINAQGNDMSASFAYARVTAGSSNAAPTSTVSSNSAETGGGIFYRIRATGVVASQNFTVTPTDSAGSTDPAALTEEEGRVDTAGITDPAGLDQGKPFTDNAVATDSFSTSIFTQYLLTLTDDATSTDSPALTLGRGLAPTDTAGSLDAGALDRQLGAADTAGATDSATQTRGRGLAPTDMAGVTDGLTVAYGYGQTITDNATTADSATVALQRLTDLTATDPSGSTDASVLTRALGASDTTGSVDTAGLDQAKTTSDSAGSADTTQVTAAGLLTVTATDTAGATDSSALTYARGLAATDDAASTDSAASSLGRGLAATDSAGATDQGDELLTRSLSFTDTAGSTDATALTRVLSASDSAGSTDTPAVSFAGTIRVSPTDDTGAADSASRSGSYARPATDDTGSSDTDALDRSRGAQDVAGATDSATVTPARARAAVDAAGSTDAVVVVFGTGLAFADDAGSSDDWGQEAVYTHFYTDDPGSTDVPFVERIAGTPRRDLHVLGILDASRQPLFVDVSRHLSITEAAGTTIVEVP